MSRTSIGARTGSLTSLSTRLPVVSPAPEPEVFELGWACVDHHPEESGSRLTGERHRELNSGPCILYTRGQKSLTVSATVITMDIDDRDVERFPVPRSSSTPEG